MLENFLTDKNIIIKEKVKDWESAISLASTPLLESKKIQKGYIQEMIDNVEELGPYIVISPQIAIAHSRPNGLVNEVSLSLLKLDTPINFSKDGHEASLIFVLAAVDNDQHLEILRQLAEKLGDTENVRHLLNAETKKEIKKILS